MSKRRMQSRSLIGNIMKENNKTDKELLDEEFGKVDSCRVCGEMPHVDVWREMSRTIGADGLPEDYVMERIKCCNSESDSRTTWNHQQAQTDKRIEELEAKLWLTQNELVKALQANTRLREEFRALARRRVGGNR